MGGDAHAQYEGKHRVRYQPARIDGQPLTAAKLDIYQFYRKEFHEVLKVLMQPNLTHTFFDIFYLLSVV